MVTIDRLPARLPCAHPADDTASGVAAAVADLQAAFNHGLTLGELDPAEILRLIDLHCNGALRCTRAALPALRLAKRAMVVNVSSRLAFR